MGLHGCIREVVRFGAGALLVACGTSPGAGKDRSDSAGSAPPSAMLPAAAAGDTGCRKEGLWAVCSVEDRLVHAGLVIRRKDAPAVYDFLGPPGTAYGVGAGDDEVHVFIYPGEAERRLETDRLDSATVSPRGQRRSYKVPPLLVTSNNMAAIVFTPNERSRERLALALSAGLPQRRP